MIFANQFNGVNGQIDVLDSASLDLTDKITVEFFVKPLALGIFHALLSKWGIDSLSGCWTSYIWNSNKLFQRLVIAGVLQPLSSTLVVRLGTWYHCAATWRDGDYIRMYVNGKLDATSPVTYAGALEVSAKPLTIGRRENGASPLWANVVMANPRVYNAQLTVAEISRNMRNPMNPLRTGLVLWHPMIEGTGLIATDYSGQGNNGTLNGGVSWYEMALYEALADVQ